MAHDYDAGDRVKWVNNYHTNCKDNEGTVVYVLEHMNGMLGIQFDKKCSGHDCSGQGPNYPIFKSGHCWWCEQGDVEFIGKGVVVPPRGYHASKPWAKGKLTPVETLEPGDPDELEDV